MDVGGKKVLVTGAAGFIGGALCRRLLKDPGSGTSVIGIDNMRSGDWSRTPEAIVRVERDIAAIDCDEWVDLLDGVEIVFHLAAEKYNSSRSTPSKLLDVNVQATERLFRSCAAAGVGRTVFTSSLYAYGSLGPDPMKESDRAEPITLYGASKLMGEGILRAIDRDLSLSWNVARLFFIYGPHQFAEGGYKSVIRVNFERMRRGEPPVINGSGDQSLDYVHVEDCVDALLDLAWSATDRKIVNVSSGRGVSIRDLTRRMMAIAEFRQPPTFGPADWTKGSRRVGENAVIQKHFGWKPRTSLDDGLQDVSTWMAGTEGPQ